MNDPIPRVDNFRYLNVFTSSFSPLFLEPFPTLDVTHFLDMLSICLAVSGWSSPWAEPLRSGLVYITPPEGRQFHRGRPKDRSAFEQTPVSYFPNLLQSA